MMRLIINADDFGKSPANNEGIKSAFEKDWISSATIMANMPAFDDACSWVRENGKTGAIGVHLNLVEGPPLTAPIRSFQRLCDADGNMTGAFLLDRKRLTSEEKNALAMELRAQVQACIENGIAPSHADSHRHAATSYKVFLIALRVVRESGIPAMRVNPNTALGEISIVKRAYKAAYNLTLYTNGLSRTRNAGRLIDMEPHWKSFVGVTELFVHPKCVGGRIVDEESNEEMGVLLDKLGDHELLNFSETSRACRPKI